MGKMSGELEGESEDEGNQRIQEKTSIVVKKKEKN